MLLSHYGLFVNRYAHGILNTMESRLVHSYVNSDICKIYIHILITPILIISGKVSILYKTSEFTHRCVLLSPRTQFMLNVHIDACDAPNNVYK